MHYGWSDAGWGPGEWLLMFVMMLTMWAVIIGAVVYVVRTLAHRPGSTEPSITRADLAQGQDGPASGSALRILEERFARGEIDADEFTRSRDLLRS